MCLWAEGGELSQGVLRAVTVGLTGKDCFEEKHGMVPLGIHMFNCTKPGW